MSPDNGELDYENSSVDVLKMEYLMYEAPDDLLKAIELIPNPLYGRTAKREEQPTSGLDTIELVPNPLYGRTAEREEESKFHSSESQHMLLSIKKVAPPTLNYDYVEHRDRHQH